MNNRASRHAFGLCGVLVGLFVQSQSYAQSSSGADCRAEIEKADLSDKTGPFSIYQSADEKVLLEIKRKDLEKDFIFASYTDRGVAPYVGQYADPKLIAFRLNGKKIEIIQKDPVGFFEDEKALGRTRALTMSDAVIVSLKLHECQPGDSFFAYLDQGALTKLSADFLSKFRRSASPGAAEMKGWRSFSDNINFLSEHRLSGSYDNTSRSNFSIRVRHILLQRPDEGFKVRRADPRIGYFSVNRRDLGDIDQSAFDTYIQKWRLEKKEPNAAISDPVEPIVFWIENTTPEKFRPYIKQGVLAWNEGFRAAGFSNAIVVQEQPVDADWEAGDISKNVIRWQVAYNARDNFGVAPAIHDPVTGEILGADILLNYAGIGDYVDDWTRLSGEDSNTPTETLDVSALRRGAQFESSNSSKISNRVISNFAGFGSPLEGPYMLASLAEHHREVEKDLRRTLAPEKIQSLNAGIEAPISSDIQKTVVSETLEGGEAPAIETRSVAERMVKEVIVQLTMHEVGHALGLSHNFRGSRWRSMDEIFDRDKTNGLISASVMDYLPINFSPIGAEQGDFANTRIGPYDSWAVEFGYRPDITDGERSDLLAQSARPEHAFSMFSVGNDPYTLLNDLTDAPVDYAKSRLAFVSEASRLASQNDAFGGQYQYLSLFYEFRFQILTAVSAISAQVTPFASDIALPDKEFANPFWTVHAQNKIDQKKAVKTLEHLIFAEDALPLSENFMFRLGDNIIAAEVLRMQAKRLAMSQLMSEQLLRLRARADKYGGDYDTTELLFDLKQAVFGYDLNPFAHPGEDRREQQLMFATYLTRLISDYPSGGERSRGRNVDHSIVSAAARPVRNALLRELLIPTPWAPRDVRAHRQELRAILN